MPATASTRRSKVVRDGLILGLYNATLDSCSNNKMYCKQKMPMIAPTFFEVINFYYASLAVLFLIMIYRMMNKTIKIAGSTDIFLKVI